MKFVKYKSINSNRQKYSEFDKYPLLYYNLNIGTICVNLLHERSGRMKLKRRKSLLLCVCLLCLAYSTVAFAASKSLYVSSGDVNASANVIFTNGKLNELVDFVGYGARVGGKDADKIIKSNAGTLTIEGNKNGSLSKKFWYHNPLNGNKGFG